MPALDAAELAARLELALRCTSDPAERVRLMRELETLRPAHAIQAEKETR